jgi:hypothetical protein
MNPPDFRALCAELLAEIDAKAWGATAPPSSVAIDHARTALAQPVAQGPTDDQLLRLAIDTRLYRFQATAGNPVQYELTEAQVFAYARAILSRWGRSTPQPIPASERLPGEGDCTLWPGEPAYFPWCWAGGDIDGNWKWIQLSIGHLSGDQLTWVMRGRRYTHWLPHWAIPLPVT